WRARGRPGGQRVAAGRYAAGTCPRRPVRPLRRRVRADVRPRGRRSRGRDLPRPGLVAAGRRSHTGNGADRLLWTVPVVPPVRSDLPDRTGGTTGTVHSRR